MTKHKSSNILINKASGEQEFFDVAKLRNSLSRAGADDFVVKDITENIQAWLYEGVSTKKIYERAFTLLRRQSQRNATLYKLKRSLFELGPSGYPFEHLIGEIYRRRGFSVEVGVVVQGHCITHEMDVIATNTSDKFCWNANMESTRAKPSVSRYPFMFDHVSKTLLLNESKFHNTKT